MHDGIGKLRVMYRSHLEITFESYTAFGEFGSVDTLEMYETCRTTGKLRMHKLDTDQDGSS